jgi:hypothetical protein
MTADDFSHCTSNFHYWTSKYKIQGTGHLCQNNRQLPQVRESCHTSASPTTSSLKVVLLTLGWVFRGDNYEQWYFLGCDLNSKPTNLGARSWREITRTKSVEYYWSVAHTVSPSYTHSRRKYYNRESWSRDFKESKSFHNPLISKSRFWSNCPCVCMYVCMYVCVPR